MKKFYSFLTAVIAVLAISFSTEAATITINVDDPSRVDVQIQYEPVTLEAGVDTKFEIEDYTSIYIVAKEGNFLKSVTRRGSYAEQVYNMNSCSMYCSTAADYDGITWDIVSCNADEARDAEVIIRVDEAANVSCQRSNTYSYVTLEDGVDNKVKFMSQDEVPLQFSHVSWGKSLYKVTHNGTAVEAQGSYFYVYPADGDVIEVTSNFPDVEVPVKFSYGEGAEGFITSVLVDDESVSNFNEENFTVKLGQKVTIYGDTQNFMFDSLVINGETYTSSYFYSYEFTVTETEYDIVVNAHKYGTIKAYVTVDNTDNVTVYRGYSSRGDVIALEAGVKTEVELSENNPYISWTAASGCFIERVSVTVNGITEDRTGSSSLSNIAEGTEISITTGVIERNMSAVVWIDDKSLADYSGSFYGSYDRYLHTFNQLTSGYNTISFADIDNPFYFGAYGSTFDSFVVYQNDAVVEYRYGYNITFADKDVVKIFFATATPSFYNVTFETEGDVSKVSCVKDIITEVAEWQNGFSTLQGTQVELSGEGIEVSVNDAAVVAGEDGKYTFVVNEDTKVKVVNELSGVATIGIDSELKDNNVYNLQGILIMKNATAEQVSSLAKGMYIINGKKVLRK